MSKKINEILLIDDDEDLLRMTVKVLENSGFDAYGATSIHEGFKMAVERVPHVIILDLMLAGGEMGYSFLERARKDASICRTPIIVLSSVRKKEAIYQAISLGAFDYIAKPMEPTILIQKIKKALKDRKFPVLKLPRSEDSKVKLKANGLIVMASEHGFTLEAPVRIAEETTVTINSGLLRTLAMESAVFRRTRQGCTPGHAGQYLNEISAVGLSPTAAARIRKAIQEWK